LPDPAETTAHIAAGAKNIADDVYSPFVAKLANDLTTGGSEGWEYMQGFDEHSTRSYMSITCTSSPSLGITSPLPSDVVNWRETFDKSSGWYDR
jgi:hypothetical protein